MIVVSGRIELEPETREKGLEAGRRMAQATRREEGCLSYAFYTDIEDPNTVRIFEEWQDEEALARHFETPHMAAFRAALGEVGIRSMKVKRYEVSAVSDLA